MKAKGINNSSLKTKKAIKDAFVELLYEHKQLDKIKISDLVTKANINRSTFYLHYDNIYNIAEEFGNDIIDNFLKQKKSENILETLNNITFYLKENEHIYQMLARSDYMQLFSPSSRKKLYSETKRNFQIHYNIHEPKLTLTTHFFIDTILNQFSKYFMYTDYPYSLDEINNYLKEIISVYLDYLDKIKK